MKTNELNKKFAQMGYLEKKNKDYHLTPKGKKTGAETKSTGKRAYVLWNESIEIEIKEFDEKSL
jgi:Mn-dependent DtxR family transcriptional regulator